MGFIWRLLTLQSTGATPCHFCDERHAQSHNKQIAEAAKRYLKPLGAHQQGRSRVWLVDSGWYVGVVEFQPSSWSKGAYLNVGAHFLWLPKTHVTFDFGHRKDGHIEFESEEQFADAADFIAKRAAEEVTKLRTLFPNPKVIHAMTPSNTGQGWIDRYHRGISHAFDGQIDSARFIFESLVNPPNKTAQDQSEEYGRLLALLTNPIAFERRVTELIYERRAFLHLPTIDNPLGFPAGMGLNKSIDREAK
jgi:hypothetical protein